MYRREALASLATVAPTLGAIGTATAGSGQSGSGDAFEPLGAVDLEGTRDLVTSDDGSIAYVAVGDGVATVDCSDPTGPTVLAERRGLLAGAENGPLRLLWDVWPDGDRLLAVAQAEAVDPDEDLHAALLFDVSDPATPRLVARRRTAFPIHNAHLEDGVAYLTANGIEGNPLVCLDTAGDEFREVGRWSLLDVDEAWADVAAPLRQLHDVTVRDGVAYLPLWDAGTWLVDVADPSDPTAIASIGGRDPEALAAVEREELGLVLSTPPGNAHYVEPDADGELVAVGRESWSVSLDGCLEGGASGIDLYDASDPDAVEHRARIAPPKAYGSTREDWFTTAHNFELVDGRLYSSWYYGGVKLHDVRDPANPRQLAWWRDPRDAAFWTARAGVPGDYFVASSAQDVAGFGEGIAGRVYLFPDRAGEQPSPPSLLERPPEFELQPTCDVAALAAPLSESERDGPGSADGTSEGAASGAGDGNESGGESGSGGGTDDAVPGFGAGVGLAGAGLAAGWRRYRSATDGGEDRA